MVLSIALGACGSAAPAETTTPVEPTPVATPTPPTEAPSEPNAELAAIYERDQADRKAGPDIDWSVVSVRDRERRARVAALLEAGAATTSTDYFHAAMVFQHGTTVEDYQRAHELALEAVELDGTHKKARWLAAATKDRILMTQGKPQLYGTQFKLTDGVWQVYETDPSITDEERARWNVPPLAKSREMADSLNKSRRPSSADGNFARGRRVVPAMAKT